MSTAGHTAQGFARYQWPIIHQIADGCTVKTIAWQSGKTFATIRFQIHLTRRRMRSQMLPGKFVLDCQRFSGCLRS